MPLYRQNNAVNATIFSLQLRQRPFFQLNAVNAAIFPAKHGNAAFFPVKRR